MVNALPGYVFNLSPSSCILPQTGSGSKPSHNLSLSEYFRAVCIQMGILRPSVRSEVCDNLTFSPQDLESRIFLSVVPHIFGTHTRQ